MVLFRSNTWLFIAKLAFTLALCWVLYHQLAGKWEDMEQLYTGNLIHHLHWLLLAVLLMPLNWGLETMKWRQLMQKTALIPWLTAVQAVLCGVTFSLMTPNRVGEFGGRMFGVEQHRRWQAAITTWIGNLAQVIVLLFVGFLGFFYLAKNFFLPEVYTLKWWLFWPILLLALLTIVGFIHLPTYLKHIMKITWLQKRTKLQQQLNDIQLFDVYTLSAVLSLAFLRYLVYCSQYFLLLLFWQVNIPVEAAFAGIFSIFMIQTGIPLPPGLDVLARFELALLIWKPFGANELALVAATTSLFIINVAIPALFGLGIILKTKVGKTVDYEKSRV